MANKQGGLFSEYFLSEGIQSSPGWMQITDEVLLEARHKIAALIDDFEARYVPNEAETERDLIEPLLAVLGWTDLLPQQTASETGRTDVPDYLLFGSPGDKAEAAPLPASEKYAHGASILEAKAFGVDLDKAGNEIGEGAPSTQILRYLSSVEIRSRGAIRFGMLTTGRVWRLYDTKARSRLEGFVEIDLREAAGIVVPAERPESGEAGTAHADHVLRSFLWLFSRESFLRDTSGATRLELAIRESRSFEARVTQQLAETVFKEVFPGLSAALAKADPEPPKQFSSDYLAELREAALTWLYRLLFVLYAEDRRLLPTRTRSDGLWATRKQVAQALDQSRGLSERRANWDGDLRDLWEQINSGDEGIGLPPYNGGLFKRGRSLLLDRTRMADADFAPLLDALSRERTAGLPRYINYRDLDVQHLGSVYERLLEFQLVAENGKITTRPQTFARKTSGSYYTPEELVSLVIRRTVRPLLDERREVFRALSRRLKAENTSTAPRDELRSADPASKFLELKICDPAMGSGHFLVSLVDYLADEVLKATEEAAEEAQWAEHVSPLLRRLEEIRQRIREQAREHGWRVNEDQLVDRQLVRRIILKRVIYGVDKNPMAVELAKLSLWLHTFTVGAPLSFLDHHLRCGDSLFGEWVRPALNFTAKVGLFKDAAIRDAERAIAEMEHIEDLSDADIVEVRESAASFAAVQEATADARKLLSLVQGFRWIGATTQSALTTARKLRREADRLALSDPVAAENKSAEAARQVSKGMALETLLEGKFGDPGAAIDLCYGRIGDPDPAKAQVAEALAVAETSNFLHWEIAFPSVWSNWDAGRTGGFDAVIGNPPWDRLKLHEIEWFEARDPAIAYTTRASDRKQMIQDLKSSTHPLALEYDTASAFASMAARMAGLPSTKGGQYPLMGSGDVNLYSLFVEQAQRLINPNGYWGLITPSGVLSDLGSSEFVKQLLDARGLRSFLDFENVRGWFPDVHRQFKFAAVIAGGPSHQFPAVEYGVFLDQADEDYIATRTMEMRPEDFSLVNPNTRTAPIYRSLRDAHLTQGIYSRVPVLADHQLNEADRPWQVRYVRMFDMTNDSSLFRTAGELKEEGWYPVAGSKWQKGALEAFPLYEGKMVQSLDHRAASVVVNPENLHRPGQPQGTTIEQHEDPAFTPNPRFFVETKDSGLKHYCLAVRDITNAVDRITTVAAIIPHRVAGNTLGLLLENNRTKDYHIVASLLAGNLSARVLDYVSRQKVQKNHMNWYILEQLPIIPPEFYTQMFGSLSAKQIVLREVLHLTYTSEDHREYATDMGWVDRDGAAKPPLIWDEDDRRQRRARLDALYFHLYGISIEDAEYILDTFGTVRRSDEAQFGRFLTSELILAQMRALAAGDANAIIDLG